jgi:hypothetical protein
MTVLVGSGYQKVFWVEATGGDIWLPASGSVYYSSNVAEEAVETQWGDSWISGYIWQGFVNTGAAVIYRKEIYMSGANIAYIYGAKLSNVSVINTGYDSNWNTAAKGNVNTLS